MSRVFALTLYVGPALYWKKYGGYYVQPPQDEKALHSHACKVNRKPSIAQRLETRTEVFLPVSTVFAKLS